MILMMMMMMMMMVVVVVWWWMMMEIGREVMRSRRGERTSDNSNTLKKKRSVSEKFRKILSEGIPKYLYSRQGSLGDQATTRRFIPITLAFSYPCINTRQGGTLKEKKEAGQANE